MKVWYEMSCALLNLKEILALFVYLANDVKFFCSDMGVLK